MVYDLNHAITFWIEQEHPSFALSSAVLIKMSRVQWQYIFLPRIPMLSDRK